MKRKHILSLFGKYKNISNLNSDHKAVNLANVLSCFDVALHLKSKKGGNDQESIKSSTTPNQGYHKGKWQKHN